MPAENLSRYHRQTLLRKVGVRGQERLRAARVLCVGAGGLGSPALLYLAGAGVGTLGIVDADRVEIANLHRQILFATEDEGKLKVEVAQKKLLALNPEITCRIYPVALSAQNALEIMRDYDVVIDGTDNFAAKFLINDAAQKLSLPYIYGSVGGLEGQLAVFRGNSGPCFRCLHPSPPTSDVQNCSEAGVLGATVGIIGTLQAFEAIRLIVPTLGAAKSELRIWDTQRMELTTFNIPKSPSCAVCSIPKSQIALREANYDPCKLTVAQKPLADEIWIDVRTHAEWQGGHVEGAVHLPIESIERGEVPELLPTRQIVCYCRSGYRSKRAVEILKRRGFINARSLEA